MKTKTLTLRDFNENHYFFVFNKDEVAQNCEHIFSAIRRQFYKYLDNLRIGVCHCDQLGKICALSLELI